MSTFVLVHGAWHGGWCWTRVAYHLRAAGHIVFTPTLTGLGERSHLLNRGVTLSTHVFDIANVLEWEGLSDIVLCGHSYGGYVVAGVAHAMAGRIRSLVYVDAFLPTKGLSFHDCLTETARERQLTAAARCGGLAIPPPPAALLGVNIADRSWVDTRCTPHPLRTLTERVDFGRGLDVVPKQVDVVASASRLDRRREASDIVLKGGHDLMIDAPVDLGAVLASV